jgi:hypothetical protein
MLESTTITSISNAHCTFSNFVKPNKPFRLLDIVVEASARRCEGRGSLIDPLINVMANERLKIWREMTGQKEFNVGSIEREWLEKKKVQIQVNYEIAVCNGRTKDFKNSKPSFENTRHDRRGNISFFSGTSQYRSNLCSYIHQNYIYSKLTNNIHQNDTSPQFPHVERLNIEL